ncbi:MAG: hypothetical protein IIB80_01730 [Thaumarchaeota archaeon]|nr:hypothetical protein [Nitrososphaerota archaeon]
MTLVNYYDFCNEVLESDNLIRFVGLYVNGEFYSKMRDGLKSYLSEEETKKSLIQAVLRWKSREILAYKIGKSVCAVAEYRNLFRITMPLDGENLCLISTESKVEPFKIAKKVADIIKNTLNNIQK